MLTVCSVFGDKYKAARGLFHQLAEDPVHAQRGHLVQVAAADQRRQRLPVGVALELDGDVDPRQDGGSN